MTPTASELRIYLLSAELIQLIEAKITQMEIQRLMVTAKRGVPGDPDDLDLTDLETLLVRLQQVKNWLERDPALKIVLNQHLTSDNEHNQRRASRRDWTIAIITTLVGTILGWLSAAAASPITVWHAIFR